MASNNLTGRMKAALAHEKVSVVFEPTEHFLGQTRHFAVAEVHQEPIGKYDVVLASVEFQFGDVGAQELDVVVEAVALAVPLNVRLYKIHRRQTIRNLGQMIRKPSFPITNYLFVS